MATEKSDVARLPTGAAAESTVPKDEKFYGLPPVIFGEDPDEYFDLLERVRADVGPRGIIEEMLVRDVVDLWWEVLRLRGLKAALLKAEHHRGIKRALEPLLGLAATFDLMDRWHRLDPEALEDVGLCLDYRGLTVEHVTALTLERKLDEVERIDRLISSAEARRNNALREIDRHRAALGAAVRKAVEETEDAEFTEVGAPEQPISTVQ